jgi:benzoylformate decarboxylase
MRTLAETLPDNVPVVDESASSRAIFFDQVRASRPGSYFFTASGGLGFGLPAAVGIGLARPETPVACVVGDGAVMFGLQAIWTAAHYRVPVVYLVLNNGGYGILKAFAAFQQTPGVPGLDLPDLDLASIARGMGAHSCRVSSAADLGEACRAAFAHAAAMRQPVLIDIPIDPTVGELFGPVSE